MISEQLLREKIHALNNHLFAVSGRIELLQAEDSFSDKIKENLEKISSELNIVRELVEEIHKSIK